MNANLKFWNLLADCTADHLLDVALLDTRFAELAAKDKSELRRCFRELLRQARGLDLWQAGSLLAGAWLGDDGFAAFQRGVVMLGAEGFERLIANPDDLADILDRESMPVDIDSIWIEDLGEIEQDSGEVPLDEPEIAFSSASFEFLESRFPKLWARFGARFSEPAPLLEEVVESFEVPGLGVVVVGDHLRHRTYGPCRVIELRSPLSPTMDLAFGNQTKTMGVTAENFSRLH